VPHAEVRNTASGLATTRLDSCKLVYIQIYKAFSSRFVKVKRLEFSFDIEMPG
jgi:hypothetical protein